MKNTCYITITIQYDMSRFLYHLKDGEKIPITSQLLFCVIYIYSVSHESFLQNMVLNFYMHISCPFALQIKYSTESQDKVLYSPLTTGINE